jgi:hypothetical protein
MSLKNHAENDARRDDEIGSEEIVEMTVNAPQ